MHIVCYVRDGDRVYETYWTTMRGVEVMDYSYALIDLTGLRTPGTVGGLAARLAPSTPHLIGAQRMRTDGRPTAQWSRIAAGRSDDLATDP